MPKKIKNEPNWENMFEVAKMIVTSSNLPEGQKGLVIDMLKYGKQLHKYLPDYELEDGNLYPKRNLPNKIIFKDKYPKFD